MGNRAFTAEQIVNLLKNPNVIKCSSKSIGYAPEFKVYAVTQYHQGLSAPAIFRAAGFNLRLIGKYKPKNCLRDWREVFSTKGAVGLQVENRGKTKGKGKGRTKTKGLTDQEKIQRLEAHVAYLKAENDFLAKLRAQRRE